MHDDDDDSEEEQDVVLKARDQDKVILQRLNAELDADVGLMSQEDIDPSHAESTMHLRRLFQRPVLVAIRKLQAYDWARYMRRDHDWVTHLGPGHNLHNSKEMAEAVTKCDAFMYAQSLTILSPRGEDEEKKQCSRRQTSRFESVSLLAVFRLYACSGCMQRESTF